MNTKNIERKIKFVMRQLYVAVNFNYDATDEYISKLEKQLAHLEALLSRKI